MSLKILNIQMASITIKSYHREKYCGVSTDVLCTKMMSLAARSVIASAGVPLGGRRMVVLQCSGGAVQPSDQGAGKLLPTSEGPFSRAFSLLDWIVQ